MTYVRAVPILARKRENGTTDRFSEQNWNLSELAAVELYVQYGTVRT